MASQVDKLSSESLCAQLSFQTGRIINSDHPYMEMLPLVGLGMSTSCWANRKAICKYNTITDLPLKPLAFRVKEVVVVVVPGSYTAGPSVFH